MAVSPFGRIGQAIKFIWNAVDSSRRFVMNFIFLLIVIFIVTSMFSSNKVKVEEKTALVINFKGDLVEQHPGSASDAFLAELQGDSKKSTQLRDILAVLEAGSKDPKITSAVLMLDNMQGAGDRKSVV